MTSLTLNPLILPANGPLRRRHIVPEAYRLEGYDADYDFQTLAYDVVWMPRQKALLLVCPKLLNLETVLKQGTLRADGTTLRRPRIKRYRRHDEVWIPCETAPHDLHVQWQDLSLRTQVSRQDTQFDGLNVLLTKSKDNALVWLRDWARHHVQAQGAQAALLFDNGSTAYTLQDAQNALSQGTGLREAAAIASDFPFGSWKATKLLHRSMFYQAGMLNLARHRFLSRARAVLPIDIDELICGASAFDAAHNARLGYATIPGVWRYSNLPDDHMPLHEDHTWRKDPDAWSKEKYCVAPGRLFTSSVWDIHGLHRYMLNKRVLLTNARMLHCEHISTGWKRKRNAQQGHALIKDTQSEAEILPLEAR